VDRKDCASRLENTCDRACFHPRLARRRKIGASAGGERFWLETTTWLSKAFPTPASWNIFPPLATDHIVLWLGGFPSHQFSLDCFRGQFFGKLPVFWDGRFSHTLRRSWQSGEQNHAHSVNYCHSSFSVLKAVGIMVFMKWLMATP